MKNFVLASFIFLVVLVGFGQTTTGTYQVRLSLDRPDWLYEPGETPQFAAEVTLSNSRLEGIELKYACGPETQEPTHSGTIRTKREEPIKIIAGTMNVSGFLRCTASFEKNGRTYTGMATAGFSPEKILPIVKMPSDLDAFWSRQLALLAKVPAEPIVTPLPERSTSKVDVFSVSFQNVGIAQGRQSRIYGVLAVPKTLDKNKRFPVLLRVPGAGVRPYGGQIALAEQGVITLEVGIHGIPVDLPQVVYDDLRSGALYRYNIYNLDDRENYYYRRVYLGMVRAVDLLVSLPQFDGKNVGVIGGSQGGALAITTAALDKRITALAASYPALSDMEGYTANRAGGWPHVFKDEKMRTKEKLETAAYYDVANFARQINVPGIYSWGFNDVTCPPTSLYASYNLIKAPKTLLVAPEMGHSNSPEQAAQINEWIIKELLK